MSLYKIDFTVGTNEDWCDSISLTTPGESPEPYPLSPQWQVRQHVRRVPEALGTVFDLSLANEGLFLSQSFGGTGEDELEETLLIWNVPKAVMRLKEPGTYVHDIVFIDPDGGVIRFAEGEVIIIQGITRGWL